ncbi:nipped-B-like protein [Telopea speciosissima]|uniref:nipped-B-like protein n=1 Tax=Telopea speciosissima TaxID=54955 RepID=UPI001CC5FC9B|nr:nipped-B-like protein [Telopea speciosissima]
MKSKRLVGIGDNVGRVCGEESRVNQLRGDLMLGDVIWVKINGCSWWPGQVFDENNVSDTLKPQNRVVGEVLVRLYGSYEYLYVDSTKCRAEFENILKENNGSYSETFGKALEQELSCIKSAKKLKKGGSEPRGKPPRLEASKVEKLKQHRTRRTQEADGPIVVRTSPRRQHDIKMSLKRVKRGELVSRKAGEEASENNTTKQDPVQEKLKAKSPISAKSSPRRQQDNSRPGKRVKSGELVKKAGEESKKNGTSKQKLAQKKLKPNSPNSARSSPRRQHDNSRTKKRVKSGELVSRKAREEASKNDTPKQKLVQKKLKSNSQNSARGSPRRQPDNSRTRKRVRSGELLSQKAGEGASENGTPEPDLVQKKQRPNSPNSVLKKSGQSQDLSERRTRVMLNLGLIAPCGSPFHRNGIAMPSNLLATP